MLLRSVLKVSRPIGCQVSPALLRQRWVSDTAGLSAASPGRVTGTR